MFDTILFDRNAFDRGVSSGGIALTMFAGGQVDTRITVKTPIEFSLSGGSSFAPRVQSPQDIIPAFLSAGEMNGPALILKLPVTISLSGQSALGTKLVVRTPLDIAFHGNGNATFNHQTYVRQYMAAAISSMGGFAPNFIMEFSIRGNMYGGGQLSQQISLQLPLSVLCQGQSSFVSRRLSAVNANTLELIGINLLPGETVTIDTDLLEVLFGSIEDVSSVSTDSVFFELNPGENEITIDSDSIETMEATAVWQNRWL